MVPGQNSKGIKAAIVVNVEAIMGSDILEAALMYDSASPIPSCIFLWAYSTTTTAPSTSSPTERINPNKTTILIVNPSE